MPIKKSELYRSLWESCNQLRGSMDASQYKDYVLVLLFMKYISDKVKREIELNHTPIIEIPKGASFYDMLQYRGQSDIGDKINKIIGEFSKANHLTGIIDQADFNDDTRLGSGKDKVDRLTNLLNIFNSPELDFSKNKVEDDDLLGDAYEYLMNNFAIESGKSKGQFYTPAEVSRVMAQLIEIDKSTSQNQTLYDPTCGSGSLLLKAAALAPKGITIYGQEYDNATRAIAVMNMWLHNFPDAEILLGNTLADPKFLDEKTGELKTFDYAVANPPFSYKNWTNGLDPEHDIFKRFDGYAIPPQKNGDYAFLLHFIKSLKPGKGKGCIVMPLGVLFRGNTEAEIRKKLIQQRYIKGIIGLPQNLFFGTGIAACLVVIDKENTEKRKGIFMIDASREFMKDGNKNRLRERDIHKIVDTFRNQLEIPGYSRLVPIEEIADPKNDYNLNIPRYIDSLEDESIQDLEAHLFGGIPHHDIEALNNYWEVYPGLKNELFVPMKNRHSYFTISVPVDEMKEKIYTHHEFIKFHNETIQIFDQWKQEAINYLNKLGKGFHPKQEIKKISERLLIHFDNRKLIDKYALYQHLMDYWVETMQDDLYEIAADGWQAGNEFIRLKKKTKKGEQDIEDLESIKGRIIPSQLILEHFFPEEKKEIVQLQDDIESINTQIENLIEENSGEEGPLEYVNSEKDAKGIINDYIMMAIHNYYAPDVNLLKKIEKQLFETQKELEELSKKEFLNSFRNEKGKILKKNIKKDAKNKEILKYIELDKIQKQLKKEKEENFQLLYDRLKKEYIDNNIQKEFISEIITLQKYLELFNDKKNIESELKKIKKVLCEKIVKKYTQLTTDEIKTLVIEKKWMAEIEKRIKSEIEDVTHQLTTRIKELAQRYETPLTDIERQLNEYEARVKEHLKIIVK